MKVKLKTISDLQNFRPEMLYGWDVADELRGWSARLHDKPIPWTTTIKWGEERKDNVFHPSSLNQKCDMLLYLEYVGAHKEEKLPPARTLIYDTGTLLEEQVHYYMHTMALVKEFLYISKFPVWKHGRLLEKIAMGGEADGFCERELSLTYNDKPLVIDLRCIYECKSINGAGFAKLRTKPDAGYVRQVQSYLASLDIPLGIIVYINKDRTDFKSFFTYYDDALWKPHEERLARLKKMADNLEIPKRHVIKSCAYCKFFKECEPPMEEVR